MLSSAIAALFCLLGCAEAIHLGAKDNSNQIATPLCEYTPRAATMNTDTALGSFEGTDDSCVSGGGYKPLHGTSFGRKTADEFHGHGRKVGCLEFTLDIEAYIETRYGRHAAWGQTCPITVFVNATRHDDDMVTGTIIDEIGSAGVSSLRADHTTSGNYSHAFTSSTYAAGTQFMMCEGRDNSLCGITVDYIKVYGTAAGDGPTARAGGGAAAVGDPHLQNVHGEHFDLMKAGKHVLIHIPRGTDANHALLSVQADARRLGAGCADMYFQELNVTGSWAEAKKAGGYHYSVKQNDVEVPEWVTFGMVQLKVVHGRTDSGMQYLNFYVKHLRRAGFPIGGLLGEDDHADASQPSESCLHTMALVSDRSSDARPPASEARASFE